MMLCKPTYLKPISRGLNVPYIIKLPDSHLLKGSDLVDKEAVLKVQYSKGKL